MTPAAIVVKRPFICPACGNVAGSNMPGKPEKGRPERRSTFLESAHKFLLESGHGYIPRLAV